MVTICNAYCNECSDAYSNECILSRIAEVNQEIFFNEMHINTHATYVKLLINISKFQNEINYI